MQELLFFEVTGPGPLDMLHQEVGPHTAGRLNLTPSLLREGFPALMYTASFTPLSNHRGSTVRILAFSTISMDCSGSSMWMEASDSGVSVLGTKPREISQFLKCRMPHNLHSQSGTLVPLLSPSRSYPLVLRIYYMQGVGQLEIRRNSILLITPVTIKCNNVLHNLLD